ncbi:stage III sporulation protein AE [Tissierellaceae bacterium BX21]|uniref:Stage III sporulation protein AE n=2 Tax=Paratissierella segnis TaxID=2763679 RepID=A0A926ETY5_9FIRM|nr:stage III sporulation protein AE [Paratissierella segnis]
MMKKAILIFIVIIFIPNIVFGNEEINDFIIEEQLDLFNTKELDSLLEDVLGNNNLMPKMSFKEYLSKFLKGEMIIDGKSFIKSIANKFIEEIKINLGFLSKILIIALISALLTNIQSTFENASVASFANYVTYILIAILVIGSFYQLMETVKITINSMIEFMEILLPILLTFLVLTGGPNTKLIFHPMILGTVNVIGIVVKSVILPLINFSFIISILSNLSERAELRKLSEFGNQIVTFIISAAFTVFVGIITIHGLSTKIDGISIRTAKFAVDRFVPVVGGFLSDAVETVIGSSAILKNGIGIIGLFIIIFITILPLIKIGTLLLIYKIVGVVIEPIVSKNISNFFSDVSKTLLLILISMVSVAMMFFITITIIVDTGNSLIMLR